MGLKAFLILKKSSKTVKYLMLIVFTVFVSLVSSSCRTNGEENYNDLTNVKKGMHIKRVETIMSHNPNLIKAAFWNDSLFVRYYDSPIGASDDLAIVFSIKDSIVVVNSFFEVLLLILCFQI